MDVATSPIIRECDIDLGSYDTIIVAFSGGKDSLAALLLLIECGIDRNKIELWHHDVDGGGPAYMDWPITPAYCRAVAYQLGVKIYFSHKVGGFWREMLRDNASTAPILFETPDGTWQQAGQREQLGTRGKFPQVSADLSVRWCSAYLKIDVMARAITGQDRFLGTRTLIVTGERAEESAGRARYAMFEPHRTDNRAGSRRARHVDQWRPVHAWKEQQVWDIIRCYGLIPHPAYYLGWGRLSCMKCIFGSPNQWATIQKIDPDGFEIIATREEESGSTIQRKLSVRELAEKGTPYPAALENPDLVKVALGTVWPAHMPVFLGNQNYWPVPAGAFGENAGPT